MRLILVRHGETDHNKTGTHMGQLDVPLNDRGRQQAELVGERLADETIDVMYTSDLQRASFTAQCIAKHHPNLRVNHDSLLRERHVGVLAGQPIQPHDTIERTRQGFDRDARPAGGESIRDVKNRALIWFTTIRQKHPNDTVVMVGHGLFLYGLLEVAVEDGADVDRQDFLLDNTGVTILDVHATGRAQVIHLNDTAHLKQDK